MSNNDLPEEELLEYEIPREADTISIIKKNPLPKEHDKMTQSEDIYADAHTYDLEEQCLNPTC